MKVDEFELKNGEKIWVCKCGTSNKDGRTFCRECRIPIDSFKKKRAIKHGKILRRKRSSNIRQVKPTGEEGRTNPNATRFTQKVAGKVLFKREPKRNRIIEESRD